MKHSIIYILTTPPYLKEILKEKKLRIFAGDFVLSHASDEVQIFYKILDHETLTELKNLPVLITSDSELFKILKIKAASYDEKNSIIEILFTDEIETSKKRTDVIEVNKRIEYLKGESNVLLQIITAEKDDFINQLIQDYQTNNFEEQQIEFIQKIKRTTEREEEKVKNLSSFFNKLTAFFEKKQELEFNERFFRGHSSLRYRLEPSNYRFHNSKRIYLDNEDKLFRDLIINRLPS